MNNFEIPVVVKEDGFYLNKFREVLPYISIVPVEIDNRIISRIFLNNWDEADALRISPGSSLMLKQVSKNNIELIGTGSPAARYTYPRPKVCPVCGERYLNMPLNGGYGYDTIVCDNEYCNHREILILWKFVRFALQIPYLTYLDVYTLYVNNRMGTAESILETLPDRYQNLGYTKEEAEEICAYIKNCKSVKATSLIYSVVPDRITPYFIYKLNTLYTSKTIGEIEIPLTDITSGKVDNTTVEAINDYNMFFITPLGKEFMKLNLTVEKNENPIRNAIFGVTSPEFEASDYIYTIATINTDYSNFSERTESSKLYVIVSDKNKNKIENRLTPEEFVKKFNIPLPKDVIDAIENAPTVLDEK